MVPDCHYEPMTTMERIVSSERILRVIISIVIVVRRPRRSEMA